MGALLLGLLGPGQAQGIQNAPAPGGAPAAVPERASSFDYRDPRLGRDLPTRRWSMYLPRFAPQRDPRFNTPYPYALQVTCPEHGEDAPRRFVVHFLKEEDQPLARRVGSVLARLYWIGRDYLGRGPQDSAYLNVWLARGGQAGGEEFERNLYLYKIEEPRAPAEWVRELAHEYSHVILPRVGPYTAPEPWASGYLGERLLLKWLLVDNGETGLWGEPIDAAGYMTYQVATLRDRFLNDGPDSPARNKEDAEGMDFYIGQVLAVEALYGPTVTRRLIDCITSPRPQNLPLSFVTALQNWPVPDLLLNPEAAIPTRTERRPGSDGEGSRFTRAGYWVFLPDGPWEIVLQGDLPRGISASLDGAALKPASPPTPQSASWIIRMIPEALGWHRFELTAPAGTTFSIRHLMQSRR